APRSCSSIICRTRARRYCRSRSKSTRTSQSTPMTPGAGLVATGNSLIAFLSALAQFEGQGILQIGPVPSESIGVATGRLGCSRLQPADDVRVRRVAELVDASDTGPGDVACLEVVLLAVEDADRLALEEEVGLLERVVVRAGEPPGHVLDHEHRVQVRPEVRVDHHLDGDARVDEQ